MLESFICYIVNSLCCLLYRGEYKRFVNTVNIEKQQSGKLMDLLQRNKECEYGRRYGFNGIDSAAKYQQRAPITVYEDYRDYIEKIKEGEKNILTAEDILLLEITSGSTSPSKLKPYTAALKKEFQMGLKPWIYNLYNSYRGIKWGKSYWSITPLASDKQYTKGGIPIGFEEDSEYFGKLEEKLFNIIFAVPGREIKRENIEDFYFKTSLGLLKCKNLTFISIWNPTFLLLILEYMEKHSEKLIRAISVKDKRRGQEVKGYLENRAYREVWKRLKVISCWYDGNAKPYADELAKLFPHAEIQPKGLLATEGFISFPFRQETGARLSLHSHFFEFLSLEDENIYLAHELEMGKDYSVIITTSGGLYRYRLNDIVEVAAFKGEHPLIRFKGRQGRVSDLFGEKLNEAFVKDVLDKSQHSFDFCMLAPEGDRYVLYIKSEGALSGIAEKVDMGLRENFHYDYCRKLGQLKEIKIFRLNGNPKQEYVNECIKQGQRLGDIKPAVLSLKSNWNKIFKGEFI